MDVKKAAHLQRELIRAAVDVCKVGGTIVYSTCSIAAEENEGVVDYILKRRFVKIVETGLPVDKEGITKYEDMRFDQRVRLSRRVYPHMHNMDGFFIAKFIKTKDGAREIEGDNDGQTAAATHSRKAPINKKGLGKRDRMALKQGKKPRLSNKPAKKPAAPVDAKAPETAKPVQTKPEAKSAKEVLPKRKPEVRPAEVNSEEEAKKKKERLLAMLKEKRRKQQES